MSDTVFKPWGVQKDIIRDDHRTLGAFAGKRGGKTEIGAVKSILLQESKPNGQYFYPYTIDPYLGVVVAPTFNMLRRLSWKKFYAYGRDMISKFHVSNIEAKWHDESEVIGASADNPRRLEGLKAGWIWLDEVFQMPEAVFLEAKARVSDSKGYLICTGSLGVQIINPKQHWAYKYFVENPDPNTICYTWNTTDNPHFPPEEIELLKNSLDPQTYRSMYEINWDTIPLNAVYLDFSDDNIIENYVYRHDWPTYIAIDWGFAHNMAVGFFQVDPVKKTVYQFDEIVQSRMDLETMFQKIKNKINGMIITEWVCDIAGNQEREQLGLSNVRWFREKKGITFKKKKDGVQNGVALVRTYIKNFAGQRHFYINSTCKKTIDGLKRYRYPEKDGMILNENPLKVDDDAVDMVRYFFVNIMDDGRIRKPSEITRIR